MFIDGSLFRLSFSDDGGTTKEIILHIQTGSLSWDRNLTEIITKDTGGGTSYSEFSKGTKSGNISGNGLVRFDPAPGTSINVVDLWTLYDDGTEFDFEFTTGVTAEPIWSGKAIIQSLGIGTDADTESTFDFTANMTGAQILGVVA